MQIVGQRVSGVRFAMAVASSRVSRAYHGPQDGRLRF